VGRMTQAEWFIEAARRINDGEAEGVCNATGGLGNPYEIKMRDYFGVDQVWPWEVEQLDQDESNDLRVLALLFMAEITADDAPRFH
jgi:hypothetical protein